MSFHRNHWLLFGTIFFGFIAIAATIAIAPAYWVQVQTRARPEAEPLSKWEQLGLEVYVAEGCVACHTQQVRPIAMDRQWGRPSAPRDYTNLGGAMDSLRPYTPALLGSARVGPDLSNVGNRQPSRTWQYLHLYNPRSVVQDSIMPAYPWLFHVTSGPTGEGTVVPVPEPYAPERGKVVPTRRGRALVDYLLSLQQPREQGQSPATGGAASSSSTDEARGSETKATATEAAGSPDGAALYSRTCASCHQDNGQGVPGTFPALTGDPVVTARDPAQHIETILEGAQGRTINGKTYPPAMPGFANQLSDAEVAAIVNHERTSWGNDAPTVTADDVAELRDGGDG